MQKNSKLSKKDANRVLLVNTLSRTVQHFFSDLEGWVRREMFGVAIERGPKVGRCFVSEEDVIEAARRILPTAQRDLERTLQRAKDSHVQRRAS